MIQISTVLPTVTTAPVPPALRVGSTGASSFALALSSLLVPGARPAAQPGEAAAPEIAVPALQVAAEPGKELPETGLELPKDETDAQPESEAKEESPAEQDPAFAWFALPALPAPEQPPVAIAAAVARAVQSDKPEISVSMPEGPEAVAPEVPSAPESVVDAAPPVEAGPARPEAVVQPATPLATRAERHGATIPGPAPTPPAEADPASITNATPQAAPAALAATAVPTPAVSIETRATAAPQEMREAPHPVAAAQPQVAPATLAATGVPAPAVSIETRTTAVPPQEVPDAPRSAAAAQTVPAAPRLAAAPEIATAPALAAAAPAAAAPTIVSASLRRIVPREPDQPAVTSVAAPSAAALQQVAATPDAQQGALDMRRQEWMGQMVERIEALRDAAPVRETRIALMPDALGKVDISVRHDGDRVHVHFTAETQAARQILTDAQPRLTEIAESRGVRLGQTSVDSGQAGANAQSGQRHDGQRPHTPSAPPRARTETESTATQDRVA